MAPWLRAALLALVVLTASAAKDSTDVLASKIEAREASLLERLKNMLQVPKDELSLAQTSDSTTSATAAQSSETALVPMPEESLGDVYFRGQLRAQEEARKKQEVEMQKRAQEAALAAAQQQAYLDAVAFQQQAILLQQAARAHYRHRRHHHRRHHHKRHNSKKEAQAPSFFQQYYGVQPASADEQAALGAYAVPQPGAALAAPQMQTPAFPPAPQAQPSAADAMRFREQMPPQPQQAAPQPMPQAPSAPAPAAKPVLSYGDPFNNARFRGEMAPRRAASHVAGNAYGMPQDSPVSEPASLMSNSVAPMAQPLMSAAQLNMNQKVSAPQLPRFRESMQQASRLGDAGNPNPSGVPMPFYSPNQAPPPAPNQLPSSSAVVHGVFPFEMQQATSVGVRPAMGQAGLNTAAINFSPLGVHADINAYPFNSFLELEHVVTTPRREVPEPKHNVVHPGLYKLASDPLRSTRIEPLSEEHLMEFPLLSN